MKSKEDVPESCKTMVQSKVPAKELNPNDSTLEDKVLETTIADVEFNIQLLTKSGGNLTKFVSVDDSNNLIKDASQCKMHEGTVTTLTFTPPQLASVVGKLESNQAFALSNMNYAIKRAIVTKGNESGDTISRSSKYFPFVDGPSAFLIDVDFSLKYPAKPLDDVLSDIYAFIPEAEHAAKVIGPSTGSNIKLKSTGDYLSKDNGHHIYCFIKDASVLDNLKEVRERLLIRAWNAGLGFIKISKSGSVLYRCPIDLSVISPERLIFEANPILSDELAKDKVAATFIDGGYLL